MSSLTPFSFDSREIRVLTVNHEPWFVAKDVLSALEYSESTLGSLSQKIAHVPEEWRGLHPMSTPSGIQEMWCLSEPGLYFFLNRSDKPKALPFQKWAAGEVFPSIRKTGSYALPGASSNPILAAQLAELLQGKVLVDFKTVSQLTRIIYALESFLPHILPLARDLEKQCGQALVADLDALKPASAPPVPTDDPWSARLTAYLSARRRVTLREVLLFLEVEPTQSHKNRLSRLLKAFGWQSRVTRVNGAPCRVYDRA